MNLRSGKTVSVRAFSGLAKTTESEWDFSAAVVVKAHNGGRIISVLFLFAFVFVCLFLFVFVCLFLFVCFCLIYLVLYSLVLFSFILLGLVWFCH